MATLDGIEIPQCSRCLKNTPDAEERTVVKPTAEMRSVLCDACAEKTAEVYPVKSQRRQPPPRARKDEAPPAVDDSAPAKKEEE